VRDERLDFLRGVGLLCIILAHVGPPVFLFQLRNFDVPLMVLVAGSAFAISNKAKSKYSYIEYVKNRFIRLVAPTWIFLLIFFTITLVTSFLMHKPYPFSSDKILTSFLLSSGIRYVWIMRVFLLVSLIAPFTLNYRRSGDSALWKTSVIIFFVYIAYEIAVYFFPNPNHILLRIILKDILYTVIPYGFIFFAGTRLHDVGSIKILTASLILMLLFIVCAAILFKLNARIVPTQDYKYPPTIYYILYAMFVSFGLYWFCQTEIYSHIPGKNIILFFGRTSMWIYLWHILIIYLISWSHISMNFVQKYIIVLSVSFGIAMVQMIILGKVLVYVDSEKSKKILKTVFSG